MTGDCQVRFCESLRGKFPRATRLNAIGNLIYKVQWRQVEMSGNNYNSLKSSL